MSRDDNIAALAQTGPIAQTHDWDRLDEVFAPDVVDHDPSEGQPPGVEGIKWLWRNYTAAFADLKFVPLEACADDDHVTLVAQMSGTHTGEWLGHAPTERKFSVRMMLTTKFVSGLVTEAWLLIDRLGILRQLDLA